jgi:hypothetical protein
MTYQHPKADQDCDRLADVEPIFRTVELTPRSDDGITFRIVQESRMVKPHLKGKVNVTGEGVLKAVYKPGSKRPSASYYEQAMAKTGPDWRSGLHLSRYREIIAEAESECSDPAGEAARRATAYRYDTKTFISGYALTGVPNMIGWDLQSKYAYAEAYPDACSRVAMARQCLSVETSDPIAMCDCGAGIIGEVTTGIGADVKLTRGGCHSAVAVRNCSLALETASPELRGRLLAQRGRARVFGTDGKLLAYDAAMEDFRAAIKAGYTYAHFLVAWISMERASGIVSVRRDWFYEHMNRVADSIQAGRPADPELANLLAARLAQFIHASEATNEFARELALEMFTAPKGGAGCGPTEIEAGDACLADRTARPGFLD